MTHNRASRSVATLDAISRTAAELLEIRGFDPFTPNLLAEEDPVDPGTLLDHWSLRVLDHLFDPAWKANERHRHTREQGMQFVDEECIRDKTNELSDEDAKTLYENIDAEDLEGLGVSSDGELTVASMLDCFEGGILEDW